MQDSNIPTKFPIPWANAAGGAYLRNIPQASQIGITNGAASLTDGFPPNCFIPIAGGGSWPWGQDANGILKQITQWLQWAQAGAPIGYDSTFQTAIGGYPKGAIVQSATVFGKFWISTVENNTTNPDTGGAGWASFADRAQNMATYEIIAGAQVVSINGAAFTSTGATTFPAIPGAAKVRAWAGGGGSGGAGAGTGVAAGPGGGGEYAEGIFTGLTSATTVTLGLPGTAGAATPTNGGTAADTSFGSLLTVKGGQGGGAQSGAGAGTPGPGGTGGTGGTFRRAGLAGSFGTTQAGIIFAGVGGAAFGNGFGLQSINSSGTSLPSIAGLFPGGGASGPCNAGAAAAGASPCLIVEW